MNISDDSNLRLWYTAMIIGGIFMVTVAIIVYLIYKMKVSMISDPKERHDFINKNEVRWYKWFYYLIGLAAAFGVNLYGQDNNAGIGVWFIVRLFISICAATLIGYVASLVLEYYYPTVLNFKLRRLRYAPRINPKTGAKMRLLSEDEEDVHLDEGMQAEENMFSIDYDVWMDEKAGDIKIEKYQGHLIALQCNNCGFYTMKVMREEIIERNEDESPKELLKHYQCTYCKNVRATQFTISRKEVEDYKTQKPKRNGNPKNIELIKMDVHSNLGQKKSFEFSSVDEAQKFLSEFDFDKSI
jgi:hypothetical protein